MHEVLVNRLGGLSLPRKIVIRLTDRPDMTLDVYRGRKTTMQQQQKLILLNAQGQIDDGQRHQVKVLMQPEEPTTNPNNLKEWKPESTKIHATNQYYGRTLMARTLLRL